MPDSYTTFAEFNTIVKCTPDTYLVGYEGDTEIKINSENLLGYTIDENGNIVIDNLSANNIISNNISSTNASSYNGYIHTLTLNTGIKSVGDNIITYGQGSLALGLGNSAFSEFAAEGIFPPYPNVAIGAGNKADGLGFAFGIYNTATGTRGAFAQGYQTIANGIFQHAEGRWSEEVPNEICGHIHGGGKGGNTSFTSLDDFEQQTGYDYAENNRDGVHLYYCKINSQEGYITYEAARYLIDNDIEYHGEHDPIKKDNWADVRLNISELTWNGDLKITESINSKNTYLPRLILNPDWIKDNTYWGRLGAEETYTLEGAGHAYITGLTKHRGRWLNICTSNMPNARFIILNADLSYTGRSVVLEEALSITRIYLDGTFDAIYISHNFGTIEGDQFTNGLSGYAFPDPEVYIEETYSNNNYFNDKKLFIYGDSITADGGDKQLGKIWWKYLERANAQFIKVDGRSGCTLSFKRTTNNGTSYSYKSFAEILAEADDNYKQQIELSDIILIKAGVNDFISCNSPSAKIGGGNANYKLGSIFDSIPTLTQLQNPGDTTFYQGVKYICNYLRTNFPAKEVVFLLPVDTASNGGSNATYSFDELRNAINVVATEYAYKVIDLSKVSNISPSYSENRRHYFEMIRWDRNKDLETATFGNDGLHPGYYGHQIIGDIILKCGEFYQFQNIESSSPFRYYYSGSQRKGIVYGSNNQSTGLYSIAVGTNNYSFGEKQFVGGRSSWAHGHAEAALSYGGDAQVKGQYGVALGAFTRSNGRYQMAVGAYNIEDTEEQNNETPGSKAKWVFICGNGNSSQRSNAFAARWDGTLEIAKAIQLPIQGSEGEFGYLVLTKNDSGNLNLSALSEEEFSNI